MRRRGWATILADNVVQIAKNHGCIELIMTIAISGKEVEQSIHFQFGYGMKIDSCGNNVIFFKKEI